MGIVCALQGGGIYGVAYVGWYQAMYEARDDYQIDDVIAISAASLFSPLMGETPEWILDALTNIDASRITAGGNGIAKLADFASAHLPGTAGNVVSELLQGLNTVVRRTGGVYPGEELERIFRGIYVQLNPDYDPANPGKVTDYTFGDHERRRQIAIAKKAAGQDVVIPPNLRMVVMDSSNGRRVTFPDDASQYGLDPNELSIATVASWSAHAWPAFDPADMIDKHTGAPCLMMDGGEAQSNSPEQAMALEYEAAQSENRVPRRVVGVRLFPPPNSYQYIKKSIFRIIHLGKRQVQVANTALEADYMRRPYVLANTCQLDTTHVPYAVLDFGMPKAAQIDLAHRNYIVTKEWIAMDKLGKVAQFVQQIQARFTAAERVKFEQPTRSLPQVSDAGQRTLPTAPSEVVN